MKKILRKNLFRLLGFLIILVSLPVSIKAATTYVPFINRAYTEISGTRADLKEKQSSWEKHQWNLCHCQIHQGGGLKSL